MKDELQIGTEISMLVGSEQIQTFMEYENDEISDFRRATIQYVAMCTNDCCSYH
jgi:hypothetical protein